MEAGVLPDMLCAEIRQDTEDKIAGKQAGEKNKKIFKFVAIKSYTPALTL